MRPNLPDLPPAAPLSFWRFARAMAVAVALLPLCCYWASEQGVDVILSLAVPPVGATIALVALNLPVRRWLPRVALTVEELVLVFAMLSVGTAIGSEWMDCMNKQIHSYPMFATEGNRFGLLMVPYLTRLLFFQTADKLLDYRAGGGDWHTLLGHWRLWARPVLGWTFLVTSLSLAMISINSLMRRQWTEQERLSFPLIAFPQALVEAGTPRASVWRDPALWWAFGVMTAIDLLNGLHFIWPGVPSVTVRFLGDLNRLFSSPPWNTTGWTPVGLFPFIVALATFMPTDLAWSMVFFYFVRKAMQIVAYRLGYQQGLFGGGYLVPAPPYFAEQTWGAFLALFVTALWMARSHLRRILQAIRTGERNARDVSARWALAGLVVGTAGVVFIGTFSGLPVWFGAVYVALYLAFSTALTRVRAELGPPTHEMAFMGPNQLVIDAMGTSGMTHREIVGLSTTFFLFNRIHRSHPMPSELEGMKLAERGGADQRWMFVAMLVAVVAGSLFSHVLRIYHGYRWGAVAEGWGQTSIVADLIGNPRRANPVAMGFVALGAAVVVGLNALRFQVPGFWLHPVGYALAMNFGVDYYWFGLIVAMLLKSGTLKVWGLKGYRRLYAAMIGIMLAEYATESLWSGVAMIWRIPTYSISINGRLGWME